MILPRPIHPEFLLLLELKERKLIELFKDLREYILEIHPDSNELLYHTHALTAVFSISEKLSDAFCMIPIYSNHLNLGFNKGTLLKDPDKLLTGTGNLIRHIPIDSSAHYRNRKVKNLIKSAAQFAMNDMEIESEALGKTVSKISKK